MARNGYGLRSIDYGLNNLLALALYLKSEGLSFAFCSWNRFYFAFRIDKLLISGVYEVYNDYEPSHSILNVCSYS